MNASFPFFLTGILVFLNLGCSTQGIARMSVPPKSTQEVIWVGIVNRTQIVWTDDDVQITRADQGEKPFSLLSVVKEVEQDVAKRIAKESPETIGKRLVLRGRMRILSIVGDVLSVEVSRSAWVDGAGASTTAEVGILNLDLAEGDLHRAATEQLQDISTSSTPSLLRFVPEKMLFSSLSKIVSSADCEVTPKDGRYTTLAGLLAASPCVGQIESLNSFLDEQSLREFWLDSEKEDALVFRIAVYTQESRVLAKRSIPIIVPKKDLLLPTVKLEESLPINRQLLVLQERYADFDIKLYIFANA